MSTPRVNVTTRPRELETAKPNAKAPVGQGGRFAALVKGLRTKRKAGNPKALAAWIGRKKYGKKRFQGMAAKGKQQG